MRRFCLMLIGILSLVVWNVAAHAEGKKIQIGKGDWPMTRGGRLCANRANVKCNIKSAPEVAWRYSVGNAAGGVFSADFEDNGQVGTFAVENWRLVRRDAKGSEVWRSPRVTRGCSLIGYEDLDGDGKREPLMVGSGLNSMAPLYFVLDPKTGAIRWKAELAATNGGDTRFGKIDPSRKGIQLVRALFPNPDGGELHMFCWDKGIEQGYSLWSWQRHNDFIYFPQLAVGDVNGDGQNEILMLTQMCVWLFDNQLGNEIARASWGSRSRSYGGQFGLWRMKPGDTPSIVVISAFNKVSVVDVEIGPATTGDRREALLESGGTRPSNLNNNKYKPPENIRLKLRWDHPFEPGVGDSDLKGGYGSGNVGFFPDSVCDLDGDGWSEIVVNESAAYPDARWHTVVLAAKDGKVISDTPGKVIVGAADVDGDGKTEVFLRNRVEKHDPVSGPVQVAVWSPQATRLGERESNGLQIIWSAPVEGELVREPNPTDLHLSRHPDEGTQVKLALSSTKGSKVFFIKAADGKTYAYEAAKGAFQVVTVDAPPDRVMPLAGLAATQSQPMEPSLAVDFDGDGTNEVVQRNSAGAYVVLKSPKSGEKEPKVIATIDGLLNPPVFADLDGDGKVETIAVRMGDSEGPDVKKQPCLDVTRSDGSLVWRKTWPADYANKYTLHKGGFGILFVTVGHFTGKNPLDVAVSFAGEKSSGNTAVLDGATGRTVWSISKLYPDMYGECWDLYPPVVLDYDGDGLDDCVTCCQTVHYTILRGTDGKQLISKPFDASNQGFGGEKSLFPGAWTTGPMLGGGDVDGDGRPEIGVFSSQASVGVARVDGKQLWYLNRPVVDQVPSPGCWADLDGDGKDEIVYLFKDGFVRVYDGITGTLRWEENLGATGGLVAADVDGDGAEEILFSSEKGILYCLGNETAGPDGSHIQWAKEFPGVPAQAIVADINGDSIGEILVPTSDGYLYCLVAGR